ncbi:zinc-binding oxidoreductase-like protein ToxD [Dothidotthia symphoricarpi CBS 119687]|uniref:Zinc-binding oxidoreductase-like protein ToxD n=1 Tax=Dothidotthia symphoricarpi CBS 119687 TaxID=1392245 RepID=A0A6A6A065_9PLEO|nr:zinc-binding oxidoreductase-like protein ToxD [Dothidotthia symphoricarpi CBS 119687]KAF2124543.1 zinc-binding oxidoreductase-like protein ToxD [Dothidotthia symphoricarpi CBS 119687]
MKEARIAKDVVVTFEEVPIPEPEANQLVIRVIVSGSNPKDWKLPEMIPNYVANTGDDIAGIVHKVGKNVWEFKEGDRVASFHEMMKPSGSFASYAVGWQHTTFKIPDNVSFEEAATIPLAAMTSAIGLHQRLGLPAPWTPAKSPSPLVVYGGASAVGGFAIKLASLANIHPIIAVAGRGTAFVETLLDRSKGDTIVDYRKGDDAVVSGIRDALKGQKLHYAYDAVSEHNSYLNIVKVLEADGRLTVVLPGRPYDGVPETVQMTQTKVGEAHAGDKDFAYVMYRYMARGMAEGFFKAHPFEVIPGGLEGVEKGLRNLKEGKASAVKYVFKIGEEKS